MGYHLSSQGPAGPCLIGWVLYVVILSGGKNRLLNAWCRGWVKRSCWLCKWQSHTQLTIDQVSWWVFQTGLFTLIYVPRGNIIIIIIIIITIIIIYPSPQWGAADAEIKVSSGENTELKRSPFKVWSRSVYRHICYAYCQGFLPCLFLPFQPFTCIFSKISPDFSCVGCC